MTAQEPPAQEPQCCQGDKEYTGVQEISRPGIAAEGQLCPSQHDCAVSCPTSFLAAPRESEIMHISTLLAQSLCQGIGQDPYCQLSSFLGSSHTVKALTTLECNHEASHDGRKCSEKARALQFLWTPSPPLPSLPLGLALPT